MLERSALEDYSKQLPGGMQRSDLAERGNLLKAVCCITWYILSTDSFVPLA